MAAEKLPPLVEPAAGQPRVSIVMPTFRRGSVIRDSLRTLVEQTFDDFELLVRDDWGEDETEEVVRGFRDPRIHYHRNPRRLRMPGNLNSGIRSSVGEYILVCHDHDLYDRELVARMVDFLDTHPTACFVHTGLLGLDANGQTTERWIGSYRELTPGLEWLEFMLSRFDSPVCAETMVRRTVHEQHGLYDPDYGFVADVELWMRLCRHGDVGYIAEPLIQLRQREAGHEHAGPAWEILDALLRMHRRYHRELFRGWQRRSRELRLAGRAEFVLLRRLAGCIARGDRAAVGEARRYLKTSGGPLSRLVARAFS